MTKEEIEYLDASLAKSSALYKSRPAKKRMTHFEDISSPHLGPTLSLHGRQKTTGFNSFQILSAQQEKRNRAA